jgi:uncharacterized protein (TIGR02145 family)
MRRISAYLILFFAFQVNAHAEIIPRNVFIQNKGQIIDQNNDPNPAVLYLLNTPGMNVQLRKGGFSYDLYQITNNEQRTTNSKYPASSIQHPASSIQFHRIDIDLQNTNLNPSIETSAPSKDYLNYYTKGTPSEGVTDVRSYSTIKYKNIYPGIDLQFIAGIECLFEYTFIIQPGADITSILLKVAGPEKVKKFREGIQLETSIGKVDETIPQCYYTLNNTQVPVKGRFKKIANNLYGFSIDQPIPGGAVLFIDPVPTRRWGTYYGGNGPTAIWNNSCTIDRLGNCIVAGCSSSSINIASAGAYQVTVGGPGDAFLVKFSPNGERQWGTYYGGSASDNALACAVDYNNNIIFAGWTSSSDNIASPGAHQTLLHGIQDAMVVKFTPGGQRIWGTYYGGNEVDPWSEGFDACMVDTNGNIYCSGNTSSPDYIASPGAHQSNLGGMADKFLVKFSENGVRLWGTYYGGNGLELDGGCAVSKNGFVYLSGTTTSSNNISTPGSFLPDFSGNTKGFLACFTLDGTRQWGTYFGGEGDDSNTGCAVDTGSNVYIYGQTGSLTNIATPGAFQETLLGSGSGHLNKFNSNGQRVWGTYYGANISVIFKAAVDDSANVIICGHTNNQNSVITSPGAYQPLYRGGYDHFLGKFNGSGQRFWGTYYGGTGWEDLASCAVDQNDNIYMSGNTLSANNTNHDTSLCSRSFSSNYIATPGSFLSEASGFDDVYLVKFADCYSPDTALTIHGPIIVCAMTSGIVYSVDPIVGATDYHWCVPGNLTITSGQHTTSISVDVGPVIGTDTISVFGINSCDNGYPTILIITVMPRPVPVITGTDTICTGDTAVFYTSGGMINYSWTVSTGGTVVAGGSPTDSSISVKWSSGGAQWVIVGYTENGCQSLQPTQKSVWVIAGPTVSVTITPTANPVCQGISVTFTATYLNEGTSPLYQWKVNGVIVGTNSTSYSYFPVNGDIVQCILTSNLPCASGNPAVSNSITMVVTPIQPVSVSISPNANPVCAGIPVTFTATPINAGSNPAYQWIVNGINVGTNQPTFTYVPSNLDLVSCILTSNALCATGSPAMSNPVTMIVNPDLAVSVSIAASNNPVCAGIPVTFTATPVNGGANPSYQWMVNGVNVGTNSPVYTYFPASGDLVSCLLTSSELCTTNNPASSIPVSMTISPIPVVTFTACFDTITTLNAKPIRLKGGIPLGGSYSGPGVNSVTGFFTPSIAGVGIKTITYTYTNAGLCSANKSRTILVQPTPIFACGNNLLDIRDGKAYPTIQLGGQCWMAADLDYGIQILENIHQRDNCIPEKYKSAVGSPQSTVYQWDEMMLYDNTPGLQGFCPPGWHIPTEADWNTLFANWTNNAFAGAPLKDSGYSGFYALLNGARHLTVQWDYQNFAVFYWSSNPHGPYRAWAHGMNDYDPSVSLYPSLRSNAFSIRCLKD